MTGRPPLPPTRQRPRRDKAERWPLMQGQHFCGTGSASETRAPTGWRRFQAGGACWASGSRGGGRWAGLGLGRGRGRGRWALGGGCAEGSTRTTAAEALDEQAGRDPSRRAWRRPLPSAVQVGGHGPGTLQRCRRRRRQDGRLAQPPRGRASSEFAGGGQLLPPCTVRQRWGVPKRQDGRLRPQPGAPGERRRGVVHFQNPHVRPTVPLANFNTLSSLVLPPTRPLHSTCPQFRTKTVPLPLRTGATHLPRFTKSSPCRTIATLAHRRRRPRPPAHAQLCFPPPPPPHARHSRFHPHRPRRALLTCPHRGNDAACARRLLLLLTQPECPQRPHIHTALQRPYAWK